MKPNFFTKQKIIFLLVLLCLTIGVFWGLYKLSGIYRLSNMISKTTKGSAKKKFLSELQKMEELNRTRVTNLNKWTQALLEEDKDSESRMRKEMEVLVENRLSTTQEQIKKSI